MRPTTKKKKTLDLEESVMWRAATWVGNKQGPPLLGEKKRESERERERESGLVVGGEMRIQLRIFLFFYIYNIYIYIYIYYVARALGTCHPFLLV